MSGVVSSTGDSITEGFIVLRLVVAAAMGALIGLQRELDMNAAGIRTHMMVSLGACLIMLVSRYGFDEVPAYKGDPGRIVAQVISGIGFLGAGVILRNGLMITGLATAATLWVCAGIGLAVGTNMWFAALITTILTVVLLASVKFFERRCLTPRRENAILLNLITQDELTAILKDLADYGVLVRRFQTVPNESNRDLSRKDVLLHIFIPKGYDESMVLARISSRTGSMHKRVFEGEGDCVFQLHEAWVAGANKRTPLVPKEIHMLTTENVHKKLAQMSDSKPQGGDMRPLNANSIAKPRAGGGAAAREARLERDNSRKGNSRQESSLSEEDDAPRDKKGREVRPQDYW